MISGLVNNLHNIIRELRTNKPKSLDEWRQWSANAVFMLALIFLPITVLFSLPTYLAENRYGLIIFDFFIIIVLFIRLVDKWGSYRFWMVIWLILIYAMMITFFIALGPHYARSAWLVFFSVMTALFLGTTAGAVAVLINMIMLLTLYFLMGPGNAAWTLVYQDPFFKYLMFVINTTAVALLPTLMAGFMLHRLGQTHGFQQQMMQDLQEKNKNLKLTEETLKESEIRYRTLFESAGDAIFVMKGEKFTECNRKTLEMFGCRKDEIMDRSPGEFSPLVQPGGRNSKEKAMEKISAALDGNPQIFEWQHKKLDGTLFAAEVSLNRVNFSSEDRILAIVRDITNRKKAEENLRESESYNKVLFRDSRIPLIVMDPKTNKYLDCNQAVIDIYGFKNREETLSKTPLDVSTATQYNGEQSSKAAQKKISEALEKGLSLFEWRHQRPNGEIWDAEVHLMSFEHKNSRLLQFSLLDITSRKKAEKEIRKARDYISNIIDSMPSVLVGVDTKGKVTQWNSKAARITGLPPEEAVGQPLDKVIPRLATDMELIRSAMQTCEVKIDSRRVHQEKGETLFEDVTIYPLIANGVEGAVVRIDDVTEQVRLEEMMVQSEKMLSVGGLAAGMAHEINNPLAGIMQTSDVMARRLTKIEMPANIKAAQEIGIKMVDIKAFMEKRDILRMAETINESGKRVARIVENMLSFARKSNSSVSSHSLAELFDKILELAATDYDLKKQYDFKAIKIIKEYEDNLPMVPCEGAKIQQVLLNILRNGAQAMQEVMEKNNEYKPKFILRLFREIQANTLCIEIEDNGPGMDEKIRKRIFEPFFTTKPVGDGTGLGLSVSYFIITENHGGEMTVESTPGSGAKFTIHLPLK